MKNNKNEKLKITIVSGFLGSGKTTFLTHYINELLKIDEKITVIMNEFGSFDVDGNHLSELVKVNPLLNGCVCCDMKSDLVQQIEMLSHNHETDHIIIEATGIAHPIELIMACQDPRIVQFVERPHVVSIVDALRFLQRQQYTDSTKRLMEEQLEVSDVLVVNKLDLISVEDRDALKNQLNEVNKYSSKIYTTYGQVNIEELLSLIHI